MALGIKNLEAQYAKALQIGKTPEGFNLLKQAALGQNDDFDQIVANMALKQLTKTKTAMQGVKAQQQLAQGKQTVRDRILAEADSSLPEMLGIGRLPAPGMEEMAAAQGGVVGYADGGEVAHFDQGGSAFSRWWERVNAGSPEYVQRENERAALGPTGGVLGLFANQSDEEYEAAKKKRGALLGLTPPASVKPVTTPAAGAGAGAGAGANLPSTGNQKVDRTLRNTIAPKVPVENPTEAQKSNMDTYLEDSKKFIKGLRAEFGDELAPITAQLEKDRAEYANMKSENVGLALLGAAGALLKPGRTTASAIGEGLGTLAEYGAKFQPQLLAARQGISSGEVGLANAKAAQQRGEISAAMGALDKRDLMALEREKLAMQRPYYAAYASYLGNKGAGIGGTGLAEIKAYQKSLQDNIKSLGIPTSAADKSQLAEWQAELNRVQNLLQSRIKGLNIGDNAAPAPGSVAGTYQRP